VPVQRSLLPAGLILATAFADGLGAHGFAYYVLLAAVVATALAALDAFGNLVELAGSAAGLRLARWEAFCSGSALVLALVAAAVRSGSSPPPIGTSALVACLAIITLQGLVALPRTVRL
jgi:hypothetical protein